MNPELADTTFESACCVPYFSIDLNASHYHGFMLPYHTIQESNGRLIVLAASDRDSPTSDSVRNLTLFLYLW